jgi:hypothetical protein
MSLTPEEVLALSAELKAPSQDGIKDSARTSPSPPGQSQERKGAL